MGLDLTFYSIKTKVTNILDYDLITRSKVFKELGNDYAKFYKFEENLKLNIGNDMIIVRMLDKLIGAKKVDDVDRTYDYSCSTILTKEDLEYIIPILEGDKVSTLIMGENHNFMYRGTQEKCDFERDYPKDYWLNVVKGLKGVLETFDFENNTLLFKYSN